MKYHPRIYAKALLDVVEKAGEDERKAAFKNFFNILKKEKAIAKLDFILREIEREELRRKNIKKIHIESSADLKSSVKDEIRSIFKDRCVLVERVKPEILAGTKILLNDEVMIDATARSLIEKMFRGSL